MKNNDISPWIVLKNTSGIGNIIFKRLIARFENPENIFRASLNELSTIEGMTLKKAQDLKKAKETPDIKNEIKTAEKENIRILHLNDKDYPQLLKEIPDPPGVIYIQGSHPPDIVGFAIVGSRKAGNESRAKTSLISSEISKAGIRVVSGLAIGIDGAAHSAALEYPGGTTAVIGSGLLNIYPREHKTLYKDILKNGAVISEFSLNAKPETFHFPARNRIISALSIGILVSEAQKKSGALITANIGAEQGKDIFTLKLKKNISPGIEALNEIGAREIENAEDIFKEYPWIKIPSKNYCEKKSLDLNEQTMIKALEKAEEPLHIDELCKKSNLKYSNKTAALIFNLEMKGLIKQLPGKFYYLVKDKS